MDNDPSARCLDAKWQDAGVLPTTTRIEKKMSYSKTLSEFEEKEDMLAQV